MAVLNASSAKLSVAGGQQPKGKDDLTLRLLKLSAGSPEVLAQVIAAMTADQAVSIAEKVEDDVTRNALVLHAVEAMRS